MGGNRGQSQVIGAVFVFAFLVTLLGLNQAFLVPDANSEIEFKHNTNVEADMLNLRNNLQRASSSGDVQSTSIQLGPQYPERYLAINPAAPSGSLRAEDPSGDLSLQNVEATDSETSDYLGGSTTSPSFPTRALVYRSSYNFYSQNPKMVVENSVFYRDFENGETLTNTGQSLVDGRRINLVAVEGSFQSSGTDAITADVRPLSTSENRISVQDTSSGRLKFTIQTQLSEKKWVETLLAEEIDSTDSGASDCSDLNPGTVDSSDGRFIVNCDYTGSGDFKQLTIVLEENVEYSLRLSKLGVGSQTSDPDEHYVTVVGSEDIDVPEEGAKTFTVEVRDEFNNPVSGVSLDAGTGFSDAQVTPVDNSVTDSDGQVTFLFDSTDEISGTGQLDVQVNTTFENSISPSSSTFNPDTKENASVTLRVQNTDASGLGPTSPFSINPRASGTVFLKDSTDQGLTGSNCGSQEKEFIATFQNSDSSPREWVEGRLAFWGGSQDKPDEVYIKVEGDQNDKLDGLDEFESLDTNPDFPSNTDTDVTFCAGKNSGQFQPSGDFFVLQVKYDNGAVNTYFVFVP